MCTRPGVALTVSSLESWDETLANSILMRDLGEFGVWFTGTTICHAATLTSFALDEFGLRRTFQKNLRSINVEVALQGSLGGFVSSALSMRPSNSKFFR